MSDQLMKIAADIPSVLTTSAQHLRKMASANAELLKRAEAAEHELRVMKLARRMEDRGLEPNLGYEEKVAGLRDLGPEKLASLEQAVELAAGGVSLGTLDESPKTAATGSTHKGELYGPNASGSDDLNDFVMSQQAFG